MVIVKNDANFTLQCGCRGCVDCSTGGVGMALCPLHSNASELLDMLYTLLPIVEDAKSDPIYKKSYVPGLLQKMNTIIAKAEGK